MAGARPGLALRLLSRLERNAELIGVASGLLLVTGYVGKQAARQGSAELEAAVPVQECAYHSNSGAHLRYREDIPWEQHEAKHLAAAKRPVVRLRCFAGRAE